MGLPHSGYSYLSDVIGSTAAARRAGPQAAARPVMASSAATARNLTGSLRRRPGTRNSASGFTKKNAQSRPAAEPITMKFRGARQDHKRDVAPVRTSARRTPISRVRRLTEYTITP